MTKEEIAPYATTVTYTNQRTVILLKSGVEVVGFFDGNNDKNLTEQNKWNFVVFPPTEPQKLTQFNGDDFLSIKIVNIR